MTVSSAPQADEFFSPLEEFHTPVSNSSLTLYHCALKKKRVDKLSQPNRVIKFCTDAGFLTTVDVGQYFMTKDTEEFSQFTESVACRGYTLPRDEESSDPKGWIRGETQNWARIGSHNQLLTR